MNAHLDTEADTHRRRLINVDEYHRMAEAGILARGERVELIEGEIIEMAPIGNPHMSVVDRLNRLFVRAVGDDAIVRVRGSIRLSGFSEPEPDLVLLRPREDFYSTRSANPADVLLLIEVSESSLAYDRTRKRALYARHGIDEYWLFNVAANVMTAFGDLVDGEYRREVAIDLQTPATVATLPDVVLDLRTLA